MSLTNGDLTTPARVLGEYPNIGSSGLAQRITALSNNIRGKLNRGQLYSRTFVRNFNGEGTYYLDLPDYPVTSITSLQVYNTLIPPSPLPVPNTTFTSPNVFGYGYRFVGWDENSLPGNPSIIEFIDGIFPTGLQNIKVTYVAGYLITGESWIVPSGGSPANSVIVSQPLGIWCRDNGVTYSNGTALTPVTVLTAAGQYIPPTDTTLGVYQFDAADISQTVLISYSFVPSDLEEAVIQWVAERQAYTGRVGESSKSLGGQETITFMRGGRNRPTQQWPDLPPEIEGLILPYWSVTSIPIGADT